MKLSEAIRLGSMMKPQAFRTFSVKDKSRTCAMGAAIEAAGCGVRPLRPGEESTNGRRTTPNTLVLDVPAHWQDLYDSDAPPCPQCGRKKGNVLRMITHLNDGHKWLRERIADFVEQIENAQSSNQPSELASEAAEPTLSK